ncbi:MAG: glycosyltransferase [Caulobacteraceae bacterium]
MSISRRVLYVTPFALLPREEGHRKRMGMTFDRFLVAGFEIDILFITREYKWSALYDADTFRRMQNMGGVLHFVHAETPTAPASDVYSVDEWWPENATQYCKWLFDNNGYEIVFCNYIFMSKVFDFCPPPTIKVIDTHDVFADRATMLLQNNLALEFFYTNQQNEASAINRADVAIAIKEQEAAYFAKIGKTNIITMPYLEPTQSSQANTNKVTWKKPIKFGFLGSSNSINVRSVMEFVTYMECSGSKDYPFELWIYGSLCKRITGTLPVYIRLGGMVGAVAEFYSEVDCIVNPQYFSTGLKIKVAEALAFGKPLISDAHAFEGFGSPLDPAQACDGFAAIVAAMTEVVNRPQRLDEMANASRGVQQREQALDERQWECFFSDGGLGRRVWIYLIVDPQSFEENRLYRHIVECTVIGLARSHLLCVVGDDGPPGGAAWSHFRRRGQRCALNLHLSELEPTAWLFFFVSPADREGLREARHRVVVFSDVAAMANEIRKAGECEPVRPREGWTSVGGDGGVSTRSGIDIRLNYFRWVPWDMAVDGGQESFQVLPEAWLLTGPRVSNRWRDPLAVAAGGLPVRKFVVGRAAEEPEEFGLATLIERVFAQRIVPRMVLSLSLDEAFSPIKSWFLASGIDLREFGFYASDILPPANHALAAPKASDLFGLYGAPSTESSRSAGSWRGSGWDAILDLINAPPGAGAGRGFTLMGVSPPFASGLAP